jgi:hypothetical protein
MRVFLELERMCPCLPLGSASKRVQRSRARISRPREDQFACAASRDHLIVDHVRREPAERQVTTTLSNDLVRGREADEVREPFDRERIAVVHVGGDGGTHRYHL